MKNIRSVKNCAVDPQRFLPQEVEEKLSTWKSAVETVLDLGVYLGGFFRLPPLKTSKN